jgi:hypothetical protein
MTAQLRSRGTGQAGHPTVGELGGPSASLTGVLSRVWTLRSALTEPDRLPRKEAAMAKPLRCRLRFHRWRRLRNPRWLGRRRWDSNPSPGCFAVQGQGGEAPLTARARRGPAVPDAVRTQRGPASLDYLLAKPDRAGSSPATTGDGAGRDRCGVVRDCPLGTGQDRCEWHGSGTASENDHRSIGARPVTWAIGCAGWSGDADRRPAPGPATADDKPPDHEDHDLRLQY